MDKYDMAGEVSKYIRQFVDRFRVGKEPINIEMNFDAGAAIISSEKHIWGVVLTEDVQIGDLCDEDLAFRAKCREEWVYPEFEEILKRAGVVPDDDYEQAVYAACRKLGIDVFLPEF